MRFTDSTLFAELLPTEMAPYQVRDTLGEKNLECFESPEGILWTSWADARYCNDDGELVFGGHELSKAVYLNELLGVHAKTDQLYALNGEHVYGHISDGLEIAVIEDGEEIILTHPSTFGLNPLVRRDGSQYITTDVFFRKKISPQELGKLNRALDIIRKPHQGRLLASFERGQIYSIEEELYNTVLHTAAEGTCTEFLDSFFTLYEEGMFEVAR